MRQLPPYEPAQPLTVRDQTIPGSEGAPDVPIRVYTPTRRRTPLPALLFIHGGGFVVGDMNGEDARAQEIAADADLVLVSVEYPLAPEHPFPAGLDDCFAALTWLSKNTAELGGGVRTRG